MQNKRVFTEQSREEITKSCLNYSRSKQLWTFSKKQRFEPVRPQCPNAFYSKNPSTLSHKKVSFATSLRRVFTEATDAPLPGTYFAEPTRESFKRGPVFGESREKCLTNSYIPADPLRNPGPSDYMKEGGKKKKAGKGFTMRPKTPNDRNYFIEDRERKEAPGPSEYNPVLAKAGKSSNSRLRSTILGWAGLMRRSPRFEEDPNANHPGPSDYRPSAGSLKSKSMGGCIGNALRRSFIDNIRKNDLSPGPGNYELPSEFGRATRYVTDSSSKVHLLP